MEYMDILDLLMGGSSQVGLIVCFLLAAGFVVVSGLKLGEYGDGLAERTGLGASIVGLVFLALVTSLPDLTVSISAALDASLRAATLTGEEARRVLQVGADLASGNLLGSDLFNLLIFAAIDAFQGPGALMFRLSRKHILSCACTVLMLGLILGGFALESRTGAIILPLVDVGPFMLAVGAGYFLSLFLIGKLENREHEMDAAEYRPYVAERESPYLHMRAPRFYAMLVFLCVIIVGSGIWMSYLGERMSRPVEMGGLGFSASFVGTVFLAVATSLPELVVSISLVRLKSYDMAAGNVLGSNIFNLFGLFFVDMALRGSSLLELMSPSMLVTIAMVTVMSMIVIIGLIMRTRRSFLLMGLDAWAIILTYVAGNLCLYFMG